MCAGNDGTLTPQDTLECAHNEYAHATGVGPSTGLLNIAGYTARDENACIKPACKGQDVDYKIFELSGCGSVLRVDSTEPSVYSGACNTLLRRMVSFLVFVVDTNVSCSGTPTEITASANSLPAPTPARNHSIFQ